MGILGIKNRTENWKTAQTFAPFIDNPDRLRLLVERLGGSPGQEEKVSLELFWKGGRDYCWDTTKVTPSPDDLRTAYNCCLPDLRDKVEEFQKRASKTFRPLLCKNYNVSGENAKNLETNFRNTEIDVVLETSKHLFVGEAKDETGLHANREYVLAHQLIRQFVIAKILAHLVAECGEEQAKSIVPFVIGPDEDEKMASLKNTAQIRFMMEKDYLEESNILSWDELASLGSTPATQ